MNAQTTWSPFLTLVTPGPTASMMPAPSWPPMYGVWTGRSPVIKCMSEWQRPAAV